MQASWVGEGKSLIRQTKAAPYWTSPEVTNPAACKAAQPVVGVGSHPRSEVWPKCEKSTATITPFVDVQSAMGLVPTVMTQPVAKVARLPSNARTATNEV